MKASWLSKKSRPPSAANSSSVQPWGNYSSATVDPNNPNSFWISNEYVASNWWQTSVAQVAIETAEVPTLTIGNTSLNVTAGGSIPLGSRLHPSIPTTRYR
jgi:hypothetical protein